METITNFLMINWSSEVILNCLFLVTESFCLFFKIFFLFFLCKKISSLTKNKTYFYLTILLLTGIFTNITLILYHLSYFTFFSIISKHLSKTFFRLEGITIMLQFFIFLCFARRLSSNRLSRKILSPFVIPTAFFIIFHLCRGGYTFFTEDLSTSKFICSMLIVGTTFILFEGLCALLILHRNYKIEPLKLLQYHNFVLGWYFILPYLIVKIFEAGFISVTVNPPAAAATSIIFTGIIYYCYKKLMGLRFLNMQSHVEARPSEKFIFVDEFKSVLDRLVKVRTVKDLNKVTKNFFQRAFGIPEEKVSIIFKDSWLNRQNIKVEDLPESPKTLYIERSFNPRTNDPEVILFANENKIMVRDEIEFTDFHSRSNIKKSRDYDLLPVVHFLKAIDVDIFLPIYCEDKIVAYLLIDHNARPGKFYTDVERDEMLIYISHLGGIIYVLSHVNLESLMAKERATKTEIYKKDRKMEVLEKGLYNFFFNTPRTQEVGILAYKDKKFEYENEAARDMLKPIDLNKDKGDDLTKTIIDISQESATFFSHKKTVTNSPSGEKILISASPNLIKNNNTAITVSSPHLNDLVCGQMQVLKDQTKWDYLVALETSDEGKIINQLLPANTPTILNSKISFFEQAVTSKMIFLEMASTEDVLSFANGIHKINERKEFEEIFAGEEVNDKELGLRLFGINPIYKKEDTICLLKELNKKGTLLIQNVHLLSLKLQGKLLEFIDTGRYSPLYSEDSIKSDVVLVCATNQNLFDLVSQGMFLKELYLALRKNSIWLPSLNNLPEEETLELAEGLRKQLVASKTYKNLMVFNDADKRKLLDSRCVSIDELKSKIQGIVIKKTQKQSISNPIINPAYKVSDFELMEAVRLGKYALKDPKMLAMLLRKFKGNQSRVAMFLGVNRSTINRRCVQFGLDALIKKEPPPPGSDKEPSDEDLSLGDPIDKELTFDEEETTKEEN